MQHIQTCNRGFWRRQPHRFVIFYVLESDGDWGHCAADAKASISSRAPVCIGPFCDTLATQRLKIIKKKKRLIPAICWFYDKVCQESPKLLLSVLMWGVSAVLLYWLTACSGFASGWQNFTSRLKTRKKKHLHDPPQLVAPPPSPTVCGYHFISVRWW